MPAALAWLDIKRVDLRLDVLRTEQAVALLRTRSSTGGEPGT